MTDAVYEGFHGSSEDRANEVLRAGMLNPSIGDHHWYGSGVYFFIEGVSDPFTNAKKWSFAQSWCNDSKRNLYTRCAVLRANIFSTIERVLDMRKVEDAALFNECKKIVIESLDRSKQRTYKDSMVFEYLFNKLSAEVYIGSQYIKFKAERIAGIDSRLPNVSMMCVRQTQHTRIENVDISWIGDLE